MSDPNEREPEGRYKPQDDSRAPPKGAPVHGGRNA